MVTPYGNMTIWKGSKGKGPAKCQKDTDVQPMTSDALFSYLTSSQLFHLQELDLCDADFA